MVGSTFTLWFRLRTYDRKEGQQNKVLEGTPLLEETTWLKNTLAYRVKDEEKSLISLPPDPTRVNTVASGFTRNLT